MRSFLPIIALISCALAAPPANKPQLVIADHDPQPLFEAAPKPGLMATEHGLIETNQTIYTYLSQQLRYTKLVKLVDFDEEYVTILNATTDTITFFAPDNDALTHKKRKHPHESSISLATLYEEYEQMKELDEDEDEEKKKRFKKILRALLKYHTLPAALSKPELYTNATYGTALKAKDGSFDGQPRRISVVNKFLGTLFVNFYARVEWVSVSASNGYIYGVNHPIIPFPSILDELFFVDDFSTLTSALQKVGLEDQLQWRFKASSETEGDGPVVSLFAPNNRAWKKLPFRARAYLFSPAGEKALKKLLQYHIVPNYILHSDWLHNATSDEDLTNARDQLKHECSCGGDWYNDIKGIPLFNHRHAKKPTIKQTLKDKIISLVRTKLNLKRSINEDTHHRCRVNTRIAQVGGLASAIAWPHHPSPNVTVNTTVPTLLDEHDLRFVVIKPRTHDHHTFALPVANDGSDKPSRQALPPLFRSVVFANGVPAHVEAVARNGALYGIGHVIHPLKEQSQENVEFDNRWDDWEEWLPAWGEQE